MPLYSKYYNPRHIVAAGVILLAIYSVSFGMLRSRTTIEEDCGLITVVFPEGTARTLFRPLIGADKYLNPNVIYSGEKDAIRVANYYFCGE